MSIDLSTRGDKGYRQFKGTRVDLEPWVTISLMPHLQGRRADDWFVLAIHGLIRVHAVTPHDVAKAGLLGEVGGRLHAITHHEVHDGDDEVEGHKGHGAPAKVTEEMMDGRRKSQKMVEERLHMQHLVDAVPVEDWYCTVTEFTLASAMLRRLLVTDAVPSIALLAQEYPGSDGIDMFLAIVERYGTKSRDANSANLSLLKTTYEQAVEHGVITNPLDMLTKMLAARTSLANNGVNVDADMMYDYIMQSFKVSPLLKYIAACEDIDGHTLTKLVQGVQEKATKFTVKTGGPRAKDIAATATKVDTTIATVGGGDLIDCPVGCNTQHP